MQLLKPPLAKRLLSVVYLFPNAPRCGQLCASGVDSTTDRALFPMSSAGSKPLTHAPFQEHDCPFSMAALVSLPPSVPTQEVQIATWSPPEESSQIPHSSIRSTLS